MEMKILLIIVIGLFVVISAALFYHEYMTLKGKVNDIEKRMVNVEKANRLRMPYKAMEEILDGMAALDVRDREVDFEKSIIENAKAHFANALSVGTNREEK